MAYNEVIDQWKKGLRIKHIAHSRAFSYYSMADRIIGLCSALLTAVVATTIFTSMSESDNSMHLIIAGTASILATIFSSASAFLKFGELAARHNQAVASFGSLRRELETNIMDNNPASLTKEKMQEFNEKWSKLEENAPAISQRIYNKVQKSLSEENH